MMYIISIKGENVFQGSSIQGIANNIDSDSIVRDRLKEQYNVEFEKQSSAYTSGYWKFDNITDDRDITLVIEKVSVID